MVRHCYSIICLLFFCILDKVFLVPLEHVDRVDGVLVRTVPFGTTVVLKCVSNDKNHNFQYWHHVNKGIIIGPANIYDQAKFKYEILSGNLTIRDATKNDEGLYECVSRAVRGEDMNIRLVKMIVQKAWEDVYENDYNINVIRILIALITLVLLAMGAWFLYSLWKERYRYPRYLENEEEEDDDESTEELFSQPSTSKQSTISKIVPGNSKQKKEDKQFDDIDISTDFKSIMETANGK